MKQITPVQGYDKIKAFADPRRLHLLRLLMGAPATLTQLAEKVAQSPAWVRHHVVALESADLVHLTEIRTTGKITEKYYRAKADGLLLQELITPISDKPAVVFSGSHDLALEKISQHLSRHLNLLTLPVGSLDGLINLRQGLCQLSGTHLLDQTGQYNTPFVSRLFPDRDMSLITLANRTQGLILAKGNPLTIRGLADLARENIMFVNRNAGSGTRLWLDGELDRLGVSSNDVNGYTNTLSSHTACAEAVWEKSADIALGLQAAANQFALDFIPLFEERYDLVLPNTQTKLLTPLLDYLQTADFRRATATLSGYTTKNSGQSVPIHN